MCDDWRGVVDPAPVGITFGDALVLLASKAPAWRLLRDIVLERQRDGGSLDLSRLQGDAGDNQTVLGGEEVEFDCD